MAKDDAPEKPIKWIARQEFIESYWDYKAGEHVSIIGETGNGKTTLAFDLLKATANPDMPGIILQMKKTDETIDRYLKSAKGEGLDWRKTKMWPPAPSIWKPGKPDGWVFAPGHTKDPDVDEPNHADAFRRCILDVYKKSKPSNPHILFADEAYSLDDELGLGRYLVTIWTKGRSEGCGLWAATQKPTHVPLWMYGQATHLFLDWPADKRARDRYREIGGMDPDVVLRALWQASEQPYQWVYVKPEGRRSQICIVGA